MENLVDQVVQIYADDFPALKPLENHKAADSFVKAVEELALQHLIRWVLSTKGDVILLGFMVFMV